MLYATNRFPGDGMTTQYEISFVGGYLDRTHVKAYIEDAALVQTPVTLTSGNFLGPFTIAGIAPIPVGSTLVIYRDTPKNPIVDFVNGSRMTEANLDTATRQGSFIAAEGADAVSPAGLAGVIQQVSDFAAAAGTARDGAVAAKNTAVASSDAASLSESNAGDSELAAANSAASALTNKNLSDTAAAAAAASASQALGYRNTATAAADAAYASSGLAGNSATTAVNAQAAVALSASNAAASAAAAASTAQQVADNTASALASKNAAAASALSAAESATQSANSSTSAVNAKTAAETARDSAISSATNAETSASAAATQAGIATTKAAQAAASAVTAGQSQTAAAASAASAATAVANANLRWPGFIRNNWNLRAVDSTTLALQPVVTNWTQTLQGSPPVDISTTTLSVSSGYPTLYASSTLHWVYSYGVNSANELSIYGVPDNVSTSRPVYAALSDAWIHPQTGDVCFGAFFPISNTLTDSPTARGLLSLANRQVVEGYSRLTSPVNVTTEYNFTELYFVGMEGDIVEFSLSGLLTVEAGAAGSTVIGTWRLNNMQQTGADFRVLDTLGAKTISIFGRARLSYSGLHSVRGVVAKASGGGSFTLNGAASLGAEVCQRVLLHPTRKSAV